MIDKPKRIALTNIPHSYIATDDDGSTYIYDIVQEKWIIREDYEDFLIQEGCMSGIIPHIPKTKGDALAIAQQYERNNIHNQVLKKNYKSTNQNSKSVDNSILDKTLENMTSEKKELSVEMLSKKEKKRRYNERKKLRQAAGLYVPTKDRTVAIWRPIPENISLEDIVSIAKKAGVLVDNVNGITRSGTDVRVQYLFHESVLQAIELYNDTELWGQKVQIVCEEEELSKKKKTDDELRMLALEKECDGSTNKKTINQSKILILAESTNVSGKNACMIMLWGIRLRNDIIDIDKELYQTLNAWLGDRRFNSIHKASLLEYNNECVLTLKFDNSAIALEIMTEINLMIEDFTHRRNMGIVCTDSERQISDEHSNNVGIKRIGSSFNDAKREAYEIVQKDNNIEDNLRTETKTLENVETKISNTISNPVNANISDDSDFDDFDIRAFGIEDPDVDEKEKNIKVENKPLDNDEIIIHIENKVDQNINLEKNIYLSTQENSHDETNIYQETSLKEKDSERIISDNNLNKSKESDNTNYEQTYNNENSKNLYNGGLNWEDSTNLFDLLLGNLKIGALLDVFEILSFRCTSFTSLDSDLVGNSICTIKKK